MTEDSKQVVSAFLFMGGLIALGSIFLMILNEGSTSVRLLLLFGGVCFVGIRILQGAFK